MPELKNIIKALLLSSGGQVLSIADFKRGLGDAYDEDDICKNISELKEENTDTFDIIEVGGSFYARTKLEYTEYIQRLKGISDSPDPRTRRALIETLAVIAMRQPVSRAEIEGARMVQLNLSILHDLLDIGWIKVVKVLRDDTHLYGTTLKFLQDFGLSSIGEFEAKLNSLDKVCNSIDG